MPKQFVYHAVTSALTSDMMADGKADPCLMSLQASTQGLVRELQKQGRADGARVLCPVPVVTGGLVEPPVVPNFLQALQVCIFLVHLQAFLVVSTRNQVSVASMVPLFACSLQAEPVSAM